MTWVYLYPKIRVIIKADPIQYNKKTIWTYKIYGESFSQKRFAFFQQLVFFRFFSECFQLKYSRNLLRSKNDFTIVTFNLWIDTSQFSVPRILTGM